MLTDLTAQDLQSFENEIVQLFKEGKIRAPIHLRGSVDKSYENNLIEIFKKVHENDYVMGFWAMHLHALLKGVPREELRQSILDGNSISLCFWEKYRILCSGIVSSLVGVAVGLAWGLKEKFEQEQYQKGAHWAPYLGCVHLFVGDMASQNGSFYEAVKYSWANQLPIKFYVEDNELSVMTHTEHTWGVPTKDTVNMLQEYYPTYVKYFKYKNKYPHSGVDERVKF